MNASTPLTAAIDHLSAVLLPDGDYAYHAGETSSWWVVTEDDMIALGRALPDQVDAYSLWCASCGDEVDDLDHDRLDQITDATDRPVTYRCQCGESTGVCCEWTGPREELVHVRWVPDADRASARASGTYTRGAYARSLYVEASCAERMRYIWEDGEQTDHEDPYVRVVGPAYE